MVPKTFQPPPEEGDSREVEADEDSQKSSNRQVQAENQNSVSPSARSGEGEDRSSQGGGEDMVHRAHSEGRTLHEENIYQLISRMSVAEKVQYAIRAPKEGRALLLKDPNKLVSVAALHSPKITVEEVELIAKSKSVDEELLRIISKNREWLRHYPVVLALVTNPKTPVGTAINLLSALQVRDILVLSKSRSISSALKSAAIRLAQKHEKHG